MFFDVFQGPNGKSRELINKDYAKETYFPL